MAASSIVNRDTEHASYGHEHGVTLSSMGILILYWLITILIQSIMTDPNPSSSSDASTQPSTSSSSSQNQLQTPTSPKTEPFLVRLATTPALLSLIRILIALPALHLTFLTITLSTNIPSPLPLHLLCPLLPTTSSPAESLFHKTTHHLSYLPALFPGVLLSLLTSPLRLLCFYNLGQSFTFTLTPPKHNKLIKTGFYKFVRHPSYLFALTGILGFLCFVLGSGQGRVFVGCYALGLGAQDPEMKWVWTAAAIGFATVIEMFRERVISEEKFLEECVGRDEWEEYKKGTPWMFVPGVY